MDIRGPMGFADYLSANGMTTKESSFIQLFNCVNNFRAACNCYKKEDKQRMSDTCNRIYMDCVRHVVPRFTNDFLNKTPDRQLKFYTNTGDLLRIVSR